MSKSKSTQTRVNTPHTGAGAAFAAAGGLDHPGTRRAVQRLRAFAAAVKLTRSDSAEQRRTCRRLERAIRRTFNEAGVKLRGIGQRLPDAACLKAWEALARGKGIDPSRLTIDEIYRAMLVWDADRRREAMLRAEAARSASTKQKRINRARHAERHHLSVKEKRAYDLHSSGYTYREIGVVMKISKSRVGQLMKSAKPIAARMTHLARSVRAGKLPTDARGQMTV